MSTETQATPEDKKTSRSALLAMGSRAFGLACSVLSVSLLVRAIGVGGYGRFAAVSALLTLVAAAFELGASTVISRDLPLEADGGSHLMAVVWRLRAASTGLLLGLGGLLSAVVFFSGQCSMAGNLAVLALCVPLVLVGGTASTIGFAKGLGWKVATVEIVGKLAWVLFAGGVYLLGGSWQLVVIVSAVIGAMPLFFRRWLGSRSRGSVSARDLRALVRRSAPLSLFPLIFLSFNRADVLGLSLGASASVVGRYSTCYRAADAVMTIVSGGVAVLTPMLSAPEGRAGRYLRSRGRLLLLVSWAVAASTAASPIWLRLLAGSQIGSLRQAVLTVGLLGLGVICYAALQVDLVTLVAARKHWTMVATVGLAALVEGLGAYLLGGRGIVAVAGVVLGVELAAVLVSAWLCARSGAPGARLLGGGWMGAAASALAAGLVLASGATMRWSLTICALVGVLALCTSSVRAELREALGHADVLARRLKTGRSGS